MASTLPRRRRRPPQPDDGALALFRDVVEKQQERREKEAKDDGAPKVHEAHETKPTKTHGGNEAGQPAGDHDPAGRRLAASAELYQHAIELTQLRAQPGVTVAELYAFFDRHMYPLMADEPRALSNIFKQAAQQLLREVSTAKQQDYRDPALPSVARLTHILRQLDLLELPDRWAPLALGLLEDMMADPSRRSEQLADVVAAWQFFSLPDMVVTDVVALAVAEASGEFRLRAPDATLLGQYARKHNLLLALAGLFPRYAPEQLRSVSVAAVATFALLTDPALDTPAATKTAAREFLAAVGGLLAAVPIDRVAVAEMFQERPALRTYVLSRWPLVAPDKRAAAHEPPRIRLPSLAQIHRQLSLALRARNLAACEAAWTAFWSSITVPDADGAARLQASGEIFDYFIMAFTTMRQPERAIAIWNLLAMAGLSPTLRTWTSFMEGCKRASNPTGIRNIWAKLVAAGVPMDTAVWTARISGLIQAGEAEAGIAALEDMHTTWEAAVKNGTAGTAAAPHAVQPTIEPINAAIAGLLRRGESAAARQILGWAGRHGIAPNLITFNTILRPLVREGRGDEVAGLLEMMAKRGIQPDEATVTVLLESSFGGSMIHQTKRDKESAADSIRWVLSAIEAAGLKANYQTYAKMVYLLLQENGGGQDRHRNRNGNRNRDQDRDWDRDRDDVDDVQAAIRADTSPEAAEAADAAGAAVDVVLSHMAGRGMPLSSHLCTILADAYFSRQPPDIEAVRSLIETGQPRRHSADGRPAYHEHNLRLPHFDRVFWERVVSGFAQADDTASAQRYFAHIADSQSVTTATLEDLLRALVRAEDWEAAAALVAKVQAQKMLLVQGGESALAYDGRLFRHRFWHLAAEYGLLQAMDEPGQ